jgi:putative transferase (TIGR04331 family)
MNKPRFLITTADERSWITDSSILFLGEWCRSYDRKSHWSNLDAKVAPSYGWLDGQKDADHDYVQNLGETLLQELADALNQYHGTEHSLRYWRIMLGPWLHRFVAIIYNRWAAIHRAVENYTITNTVILDLSDEQLIPFDYQNFAVLYRSDNWNHAIYGKILQGCTNVPCDIIATNVIDKDTAYSQKFTQMPSRTFKMNVRSFMATGLQFIEKLFSRSTDALIISSYLPFIEDCKLHMSLGQIPTHRRSLLTPHVPPNFNVRNQFRLRTNAFVGFEPFIRDLIPQQIPTCFLEGYVRLLDKVKELPWPVKPKLIFTSNNFDSDEVFKVWAASKVELGVPYIIGQHGGNYGTSKFASSEKHEVATADRYLTWGWKEDCIKHYPVVAFPLVGRTSLRSNTNGGLLLVERTGGHREEPWDDMEALNVYREDQFIFVKRLFEPIKKVVTVRLFAAYLCKNWFDHILWEERCPSIKIDFCLEPIDNLIQKNRLTVFTFNSTGILENLALNNPIIIFFNDEHFPLRSSAEKHFQKLKSVGVFHTTPESASDKINEIWDDVEGWWGSDELQQVRRLFCNQFVRLSKNPIQEIKKALLTTRSTI